MRQNAQSPTECGMGGAACVNCGAGNMCKMGQCKCKGMNCPVDAGPG
ncbi:MAG TPA: hypothetical protein VMH61_06230 [Candidatus Acidoferrales bacterium]|nr:hypothetical protein [Candidatus Acidoferrales bacterium]